MRIYMHACISDEAIGEEGLIFLEAGRKELRALVAACRDGVEAAVRDRGTHTHTLPLGVCVGGRWMGRAGVMGWGDGRGIEPRLKRYASMRWRNGACRVYIYIHTYIPPHSLPTWPTRPHANADTHTAFLVSTPLLFDRYTVIQAAYRLYMLYTPGMWWWLHGIVRISIQLRALRMKPPNPARVYTHT